MALMTCCTYSFSISKKKQIERTQSFQLLPVSQSVFAGAFIKSRLLILLQTGERLYSDGRSKIGFKDFYISVSGSGKSYKVNKKALTLRALFDAFQTPYVYVTLQMIKRPDIKLRFSIPIHFNGQYLLNYNGGQGTCGTEGSCGNSGQSGCAMYDNGHGGDGSAAEDGDDGSDGDDGTNASNVSVYVSQVFFERDQCQLVKIETYQHDRRMHTRYINKTGKVYINACGGNGGNGGEGGAGGEGGSGGDGSFKKPEYEDQPSNGTSDGDGGNGGDGGDGGHGGNGGNGGNGGDVSIYFSEDTWFFKNQIIVYNTGGLAGEAGVGGGAGDGGDGGSGGRANGSCGSSGYCGRSGFEGTAGTSGTVQYFDWNRAEK